MNESIIVSESREQRTYYFDFLRVFGTFAVMFLHIAAQNWDTKDVHSFEWSVMNFYNAIARWSVPAFVMISGALFLSRDIPIRKIYSKYIFRIFTAFVFWSVMYTVFIYDDGGDRVKYISHLICGHYHIWFLFMISGLYMIVPFVKKIAESKFLTKYFLEIAFLFAFLPCNIINTLTLFSKDYGGIAWQLFYYFYFNFVAGYTGYFLLGYFVNNTENSRKTEYMIYTAGIIGFAATVLMTLYASRLNGTPTEIFYENISVNILCETVAVFVFFRKNFNFPAKNIRTLSQYSFGAYLVHAGVIYLFEKFGINSLTFSPIISIPVIAVIVFIVSFAISAVLNQMPVLRKYIV